MRDARGSAMFVLALAVAIGWVVTVLVAALTPGAMSTRSALLLYGLGGAIVGGVIGWGTGKTGGGRHE